MKDLKCISIKHFQHVYNVWTCLEHSSKVLIEWTIMVELILFNLQETKLSKPMN